MLKIAVVGAQDILGQELVRTLEAHHCSVLPLASGPLTKEQEENDIVAFAPTRDLIKGYDAVILAQPEPVGLLDEFLGRVLDVTADASRGTPAPLTGPWGPENRLFVRPAVEQILLLLPHLVENLGTVSGVYLRSVSHRGELGLMELHQQSVAVLQGEEPDSTQLGYRAAFEVVPQKPKGRITDVFTPTFHGDLLVLNLVNLEKRMTKKTNLPGQVKWADTPPTSRDVATRSEVLVYADLDAAGQYATLVIGFDAILWGVLQPMVRLLSLKV